MQLVHHLGLRCLANVPPCWMANHALKAKVSDELGRVLRHEVIGKDCQTEDGSLEQGHNNVAYRPYPNLNAQEMPMFHLVKFLHLLSIEHPID